jgi:hypothetical protein
VVVVIVAVVVVVVVMVVVVVVVVVVPGDVIMKEAELFIKAPQKKLSAFGMWKQM